MGRFPRFKASSVIAALLVCAPAFGVQAPAGAEIQIRLRTKVSSQTSKPNDPVEAAVIAPVMVAGEFVIPAGAVVRGVVETAKAAAKADDQATLTLKFTELEFGGDKLKLAARVAEVDNARESVDAKGQILGILVSQTITGRLDEGIGRVSERYAGLADVLETAKAAVLKPAEGGIAYDPGVEMALALTAPLELKGPTDPGPAANLQPVAREEELAALAAGQPFQTMAEKPSKPSDITNLMLIGTAEQVQQVFSAAGWSSAAALNAQSKLETFRSIAELRGYNEAPVSVLLLEGKPPDMVFQKQNNTFAQRHHLRVWRRPATFEDLPVWVVAATHDIGIDFSPENRTFIHKIDSEIDRERAKVVNDLMFTGRVQSLALVPRPDVPTDSQNATGDSLTTDAGIAVLVLR